MRKAFGQENQYLNLSKQSVYHPGKLNVISRAFGEFLVSIAEKKKKLSFCTKLLSLALDVKTSMLSSLSFLAQPPFSPQTSEAKKKEVRIELLTSEFLY